MNYIDFLKDFINSEFATNNIILLIVLSVFFIVLGGVIVWLYHKFIKNNRLYNSLSKKKDELEEAKKELEEAKKESEKAQGQIKKLEDKKSELEKKLQKYEIQEGLKSDYNEDTISPAIQGFIK